MLARLLILALVVGGSLVVSGCHARGRVYATTPAPHASGVVVYNAPPARRVVVQAPPPAPYAGAIWVEGHWQWNGAQYVWMDGYYTQPRAGYVYVQPRWERRGTGWVYVSGDWRAHRGAVRVHQPRGRVQVQHRSRGTVRVQEPRGRARGRATVRVR